MQHLQIRAQVKCTFLPKNYQIKIILVNIQNRAYNFKIKRIPRTVNIFTRKNKKCYVNRSLPYNRPSLSIGHKTVTITNHCYYCFDGLWKMKTKYLVFETQSTRGASRHPLLMDNCPTCSHMPWPYQSIYLFIYLFMYLFIYLFIILIR